MGGPIRLPPSPPPSWRAGVPLAPGVGGRVASRSGEKRLCRLMCGKPLAFRRSPPPFAPPLGWKAKPSSRAEGVNQGSGPRKGEAVPHIRRQSRFAIFPFGDFDAALGYEEAWGQTPGGCGFPCPIIPQNAVCERAFRDSSYSLCQASPLGDGEQVILVNGQPLRPFCCCKLESPPVFADGNAAQAGLLVFAHLGHNRH